jgi:acetyltransferase
MITLDSIVANSIHGLSFPRLAALGLSCWLIARSEPLAAAEATIEASEASEKPVLTCWMGKGLVDPGRALFGQHQLAHFDTPEASVEAFSFLASYRSNQELLMQTPGPFGRSSEPDVEGARLIIEGVLAEGRTQLSELESKAILMAFGVPVVEPRPLPAEVGREQNSPCDEHDE